MNSINLIGRLTAAPEMSEYGKKGDMKEIAKWTLAVDRMGSEEADFIRCTAFGKTAEFAGDYLKKGQRVGVSGRVQTGSYEDKDGVKRTSFDVIVERITFADGKAEDKKSKKRRDDDDD